MSRPIDRPDDQARTASDPHLPDYEPPKAEDVSTDEPLSAAPVIAS